MKKNKIAIRRETIRSLETAKLGAVNGGAPTGVSSCCPTIQDNDQCKQQTAFCPIFTMDFSCRCQPQ